jgi:hypothetical protein
MYMHICVYKHIYVFTHKYVCLYTHMQSFGAIGPVHIGPTYTKILLEIIAGVVSEESGGADAASNRKDVVRGLYI